MMPINHRSISEWNGAAVEIRVPVVLVLVIHWGYFSFQG